ncbi:hypothetical protein ACA910_012701 [Epithemia clementina (nom. ined.)]
MQLLEGLAIVAVLLCSVLNAEAQYIRSRTVQSPEPNSLQAAILESSAKHDRMIFRVDELLNAAEASDTDGQKQVQQEEQQQQDVIEAPLELNEQEDMDFWDRILPYTHDMSMSMNGK